MQDAIAFTPQIDASFITRLLWLIPALPIVAAGFIAVLKQPRRKLASSLAIGSLGISLLIAILAFVHVLSGWSHGHAVREVVNFSWLQVGTQAVELGWVLDPLALCPRIDARFERIELRVVVRIRHSRRGRGS